MLATVVPFEPVIPEIGIPGLILILVVALLVFGPKRLPEMGRSLGRGMREFKDSVSGHQSADEVAELPSAPQNIGAGTQDTGAGFCSSCGTPLTAGAQFCASCGTPVASPANGPSMAARDTATIERDG
jgi:sec-independent protein translocase protein TatA